MSECAIMMGCPGSGKTTYATTVLATTHYRIDGDLYKTPAAMMKAADAHLAANPGASIVFDSTGVTRERRRAFVEWGRKRGMSTVRFIWVRTSVEESLVRNKARDHPVPAVALYTFRKRFEPPNQAEEAVDEILYIDSTGGALVS